MSLFIAAGILFYLFSQSNSTNQVKYILPPWGVISPSHINEITKNKFPFLTQRIIKKLRMLFLLNVDTTKKELNSIREWNQQLNQKVSYDDKTHYDLFKQEDTSLKTYQNIIIQLNKHELNLDFDKVYGEVKDYSPVIYQVKYDINRLRPFQASYILKIPIKHLDSESADTPSMPAGHTIQSLLFAAIIYRDNKTFFENHIDLLKWMIEICLDVGKRRVIAGLHYPSDNIAGRVFVMEVIKEWNIEEFTKYLS